MKLSNSKNTVKCPHDKGSRGSRKKRLPKLLSLMLAAVLIASAAVGDTGIGTVKAGTDVMMIIENANGSDNLEDYIPETGGMVLQKKDPETGEWVELSPDDNIVLGNNYRLKVHFEGGAEGFKNPMTWDLGNNVKCVPKTNEPIWNGSTQIGTYTLTEDGKVTVNFTEDFLAGDNQKLDMTFDMVPTNDAGDEDNRFPWSGHITDHTKVERKAALDVDKVAGSYHSDGSISYTVEATVTEGMITDGKLYDEMQEGLTFQKIEEMKVYDAEGNDVTERYQDSIDKLKKQAEGQEKQMNWTLTPLPPLSQGMRFVVKYRSLVSSDNQMDSKFVAKNTVTFSATVPGEQEPVSDTDTEEKPLAKSQITKSGNATTITVGEEKKEVIEWKVRIGSGQWDPFGTDPLIITDTLGTGLSFYKGKNIQVHWYDKNGTERQTAEIDWGKVTFDANEKEAKYNLSSELFEGYKWENGDYLEVTYYTEYDPSKQPQNGYDNTVKNDVLAPEGGVTGWVPVGESVQKTVVDHEEENYLLYTVVVEIPPASHMKSMKGHNSDGHIDLDLPYFYIEDQLDFGDEYFALNVPSAEDVSVKVEGKVSGQIWEFDNVPYTNGSGNPEDKRETFQILEGPEEERSTAGKNRRAFRIYFNTARYGIGTDNELERHDSIWDINEATRMTITYKVPYSTPIVDAAGKDTGRTLGELLNEGIKLENKAVSRRSGVDLENSCFLQKAPEQGNINKLARILEEGVVEYRASFVNCKPNTSSRIITDKSDDERYYGKLQPRLEDVFDERMEYLDGSLYVEVRDKDGKKVYATYKYDGTPSIVGNLLSFYMEDPAWKQTSNDGEHYTKGEELVATFNSSRTYVFVYRLQLKEDKRKDWKSDEGIENTATLKYGSVSPSDSAIVDIPSDMLQKSFTTTSTGTLEYTLNVNSAGANLVQVDTGEGVVNLESYKLVDEMSDNLQLLTDNTGDYIIHVNYWDGSQWQPLTRSNNAEGINKEAHNYFRSTGENNSIYFILPDELHIQITYEVMVNGEPKSDELASNTATLYADYTETEHKITIVEVGESSATGSSDPVVRLEKQDSESGSLLPGAVFDLYSSEGTGSTSIEVEKDGTPIKLYRVQTYTTDANGAIKKIVLSKEDASGFSEDTLYALVETKAPEGYILNPEPYFFRFLGSNTEIPAPEKVTYTDGQPYEVHYEKSQNTIVRTNEKKRLLRLLKTDTEGNNLPGASFSLYEYTEGENDSWSIGELLYTGLSDSDGVVLWKEKEGSESSTGVLDLKNGIYYVKEESAPDGYQVLEEPIIITVKDGKITSQMLSGEPLPFKEEELAGGDARVFAITFTVKNEKVKVSPIRIVKTDISGMHHLSGAVFELYETVKQDASLVEGDLLWRGESDENGTLKWNAPLNDSETKELLELEPGVYHLKETAAPDGYIRLEDTIVITVEEGGTISFSGSTMVQQSTDKDEAGVVNVSVRNSDGYALPETGGQGYAYLYLLGGIFTVLGVVFLLNKKRVYAKRS